MNVGYQTAAVSLTIQAQSTLKFVLYASHRAPSGYCKAHIAAS